jgi:hypothetical protein
MGVAIVGAGLLGLALEAKQNKPDICSDAYSQAKRPHCSTM